MRSREVKRLKTVSPWLKRLDEALQLDQLVFKKQHDRVDEVENGDFGNCLWIGPPGHTETMHYDDSDNVHTQLVGCKRWILFSPTICRRHVFPPVLPLLKAMAAAQIIETKDGVIVDCATSLLSSKEIESMEGMEGAFTVDLKPGEAIFVPAGWGHQVTTLASRLDPTSPDFVVSYNRFLIQPTYTRLFTSRSFTSAAYLVLKLRLYMFFSNTVFRMGANAAKQLASAVLCLFAFLCLALLSIYMVL